MTYSAFKTWVRDRGLTVAELRSENAPPSAELYELMCDIGLAKYEKFVLRLIAEAGR